MKLRTAVYGWLPAVIVICMVLWLGGRWLPSRGFGYAFHEHSEFGSRESAASGAEVRVEVFNVSAEYHSGSLPFVMCGADGDTHVLKVEIRVPEEIEGEVRIVSASVVAGDRTMPLQLGVAGGKPPETDWHKLEPSYRGPGRLVQLIGSDRMEIPRDVSDLGVGIAFEIRTGGETRQGTTALKLARREWESSGFLFNWRQVFGN